ncbi:MAG: NMD3-related protein [Patescibacteria group bacterium]
MGKNISKIEKFESFEPRTEKHEMPKGKLGLVLCKECNAAYYKKSWHHNLRHFKELREDLRVSFVVCPACNMIKNKQFEGQIEIINIPLKISEELINLIKSFCRRAYERDPMDRLIGIKNTKGGLEATTTENQLAVKLAKKIKQTFKKVDMKISYSPTPSDVVYVKLEFSH